MQNSKKLYLVIILILSISLIFTACSNDSSSPNIDNKNTYTISGTVIGLENEGVKDVVLHFSNDDESVKTNSSGEWQKSGLSGEVEVTPVKEGYEFSPKSKKVSGASDNINFSVQNFIIIPETTKVINDESSLQIEQLTDNQIIMNKNSDFVKSVKVNDILVSGVTENTPFGMLRQVENKSIEGDSIVFQTSMASLDQAIKKGNIHKEIIFKQQDVLKNEVLSSGVDVGAANNFSKEFRYQLDKIIYDNDGNNKTEHDQVVTKGSVAFGYKLILDIEIDSFKLENFSIKTMVEGDQNLSISSGISYSKDEDFRIAEINFAPMTFHIPIPLGTFPLVITPNLGVDIGYSGSISSEVVTSTSLSQKIEGGVNYNNSGWKPIKNLDLNYDFKTPSLETGANFIIAAGPELTTMVYELAGPNSKIAGYSQLEADPIEEIWWELYGGINGSVGVKIEVFSIHIADYEKEIIDYRKLLAEANAVPVINSIDDKTIKEGENIEFKISASDPNNDQLTYSASGDLTEKFNNETQIFSWTPVKGEAGNYKITFEVTDGKESDTESVNITVNENLENSPPFISDLTNNISELQVTISAEVNDIDDNLSEVTIDWEDNNKTNINSGFDNINESHIYENGGSYTISLTAIDDVGATVFESLTVNVSKTNEPPIIDLSASTDKLTATISGSIKDSDGSISSSEIDWGDENTTKINSGFDTINETHTYANEGTYNVIVIAVDNDEKKVSESLTMNVIEDKKAKWTFKTENNILSSPAIGEDGTIYVGNFDHNLYAINEFGAEEWRFSTSNAVNSSPAIGEDGTIYVGSNDGNLYAVNPDGTEKWSFNPSDFPIISSPAIGEDGTIYVGSNDSNLYAVNPDGTEKWTYKTEDEIASSPAIGEDGTIYIGSNDFNLYAVNPDGTEKWSFKTRYEITSSPVIGEDSTIYVGSDDKKLYALNSDGTEKWNIETGYDNSSPAIAEDSTIYVGGEDTNLYAINPDGTEKWSFKTDDRIRSTPAIGGDGTIYFGSHDHKLYAVNPDGTKKWEFEADETIYCSPAIGEDGTIYFGSYDNKIYAIESDSNGLSNSAWPKFKNNNRNTGKREF